MVPGQEVQNTIKNILDITDNYKKHNNTNNIAVKKTYNIDKINDRIDDCPKVVFLFLLMTEI